VDLNYIIVKKRNIALSSKNRLNFREGSPEAVWDLDPYRIWIRIGSGTKQAKIANQNRKKIRNYMSNEPEHPS
jgi:hypothetical protein